LGENVRQKSNNMAPDKGKSWYFTQMKSLKELHGQIPNGNN